MRQLGSYHATTDRPRRTPRGGDGRREARLAKLHIYGTHVLIPCPIVQLYSGVLLRGEGSREEQY